MIGPETCVAFRVRIHFITPIKQGNQKKVNEHQDMEMKSYYLIFSLIVACTLISACIATESDGSSVSNSTTPRSITLGELLENPSEYTDQVFEITGKITSQCGSGCWFIISDESGDLFVDLKPKDFVIPPSMGKEVTVTGIIKVKGSDVSWIGDSVTINGKTYP